MSSRDTMSARFSTSIDGKPVTTHQIDDVGCLKEAVVALAELLDKVVPEGRNKSLAFTALEDVHMRANRGIFNP